MRCCFRLVARRSVGVVRRFLGPTPSRAGPASSLRPDQPRTTPPSQEVGRYRGPGRSLAVSRNFRSGALLRIPPQRSRYPWLRDAHLTGVPLVSGSPRFLIFLWGNPAGLPPLLPREVNPRPGARTLSCALGARKNFPGCTSLERLPLGRPGYNVLPVPSKRGFFPICPAVRSKRTAERDPNFRSDA